MDPPGPLGTRTEISSTFFDKVAGKSAAESGGMHRRSWKLSSPNARDPEKVRPEFEPDAPLAKLVQENAMKQNLFVDVAPLEAGNGEYNSHL